MSFAVRGQTVTSTMPLPVTKLAEEGSWSNPENGDVLAQQYSKPYDFSKDWFSFNITVWQEALKSFRDKEELQYLEIGVFEGRAFLWMLENIATHQTSRATAVDPFVLVGQSFPKYAERFFNNIELSGQKHRTRVIRGYSQTEIRKLPLDHYDIIYIDGSHSNDDALEDAILSMRLLKEDGILIFDDYVLEEPSLGGPKQAIELFFQLYGKRFTLLHVGHQVILKKNSNQKG